MVFLSDQQENGLYRSSVLNVNESLLTQVFKKACYAIASY